MTFRLTKIFAFLLLVSFTSCDRTDPIPDPVFQIDSYFTSTFHESSGNTFLLESTFKTVYMEDVLSSIEINKENCFIPLGQSTCDLVESNFMLSFLYDNELVSGSEASTSEAFTDPMKVTIKDGQLVALNQTLIDKDYQLSIIYEGNKLTRMEYGRVGISNLISSREFFYDGNNVVRSVYDHLSFGSKIELSFTYDETLNPFFGDIRWFVATTVLGIETKTEDVVLLSSRNNVRSMTLRSEQNGQTISRITTFSRTYDSDNRLLTTTSREGDLEVKTEVSYK